MDGVHEYKDFYANCDHMPGPADERSLHVGGTVAFTEGGWSARLEEHQGGPIPFNPLILQLDLVLTPPTGGTTKQIDDVELEEWTAVSPAFEYDEVQFLVQGPKVDPPPSIKVKHLEIPERSPDP